MPPNLYGTIILAETCSKPNTDNPEITRNAETNIIKKSTKNSLNIQSDLNSEKSQSEEVREIPAKVPGPEYKLELVWRNIIIFSILHIFAIYGIFVEKSWATVIFGISFGLAGGFGITGGAHRLFAHKAFKANTQMKILLLAFQTIAFQNSVYEWVRDHRVHHKFTDTNADPHNASRGFFFSHMGWLLCKKHPDVKKFGAKVSMSDLEADPYIMFQHNHYMKLMFFFSLIMPTVIPILFWNEGFKGSFFNAGVFRYILSLHFTWLINSAAHSYGMKPFDKNISPSDSHLVSFLALGEGWHNYHHVFPWDYKTAELGKYAFNYTTAFLDFFAWIGWATDLRTVSDEIIRRRVLRTGDGSHKYSELETTQERALAYVNDITIDNNGNHVHNVPDLIWGFDDKDMPEEEKKYVTILNRGKN